MKKIILVLIIVISLFFYACTTENTNSNTNQQTSQVDSNQNDGNTDQVNNENPVDQEQEVTSASRPEWQNTELTDVSTGETYKISDFEGKPVLVESFAVWCPTCTRQQKEVKELHEIVGDDVVSIGLNTDPNEDEDKVLDHIQSNGFDWRYSISPTQFTQSLIGEFGVSIVNAPSAPMILICGDGTSHFLDRGVKSASKLQDAIDTNCNA